MINDIFLFENIVGVKYVYFSKLNSVYKVTDRVANFLNGNMDSEIGTELDNIIESTKNLNEGSNTYIYTTIEGCEQTIQKHLLNETADNNRYVFLDSYDYTEDHDDILYSFLSFFKDKGYKVKIKRDINTLKNNYYHGNEFKFNFVYQSDLNCLKRIVTEDKSITDVVELELKTIDELEELFNEVIIPDNMKLMLTSHDNSATARAILEKFANIILGSIVFRNKKKYSNLIHFNNITLGVPIPEIDIIYSDKDSLVMGKDCLHCGKCWAKKLCWSTNAYYVFARHPYFLNSSDDRNCDLIRNTMKDLLIIYVNAEEVSKLKNREYLPIKYTSKGYKIRLLNP